MKVMDGTQVNDEEQNDMSKANKSRGRTRFSPWQVEKLRSMFQSCNYPDDVMYESMAIKLNLKQNQVVKWFKNHRWKKRKQGILDPISPEISDSKDYRNKNENSLEDITNQEAHSAPENVETTNLDVNNAIPDENGKRLNDNDNTSEESSTSPENNEYVYLDVNNTVPDENDKSLDGNTIQETHVATYTNDNENLNTQPMNVNNSEDYFDEFSGKFEGVYSLMEAHVKKN